MLVDFRVGNYLSFRERQTLSMVASSDATHPINLIPWEKDNLLKTAVVYGANASGKSNLVSAFGFLRRFVTDSATRMNVGDEIGVVPFQLDTKCAEQPSFFEVTLILNETRFVYGFTATRRRVHDEWLVTYPLGKPRRALERRFDRQAQETTWVFRGPLRKHAKLLKERTRDNGLVLSRGAEQNVEDLVAVFQAIGKHLWILNLSDELTIHAILQDTAEHWKTDSGFRERTRQLIRDADLGIQDLHVAEEKILPYPFRDEVLRQISGSLRQVLERNTMFRVQSVHSIPGTSETRIFDFDELESKGTRRFFALLGPWLNALEHGAIVVVDELDCSMHPILTRALIEFFQSPEFNDKGAQLIFSTHDTTLMDLTLFRRDQIWLIEKKSSQASELFSLYDFDDKPRKGEAVEKRYLAGRYGSIPHLGLTFQDLELR